MSCQAEKRARVEAILGRLAEISLAAAEEILVRLRESEDANETAILAGALQKISRVTRLTLALDSKLDRDAARDAREAQKAAEQAAAQDAERAQALAASDEPDDAPPHPVELRKRRVSGLLQRLIWNECEGETEEFGILNDDLDARLEEAALSPEFETTPVETLARRIAADMGLSGDFALTVGETSARDAPPSERPPPSADTG